MNSFKRGFSIVRTSILGIISVYGVSIKIKKNKMYKWQRVRTVKIATEITARVNKLVVSIRLKMLNIVNCLHKFIVIGI